MFDYVTYLICEMFAYFDCQLNLIKPHPRSPDETDCAVFFLVNIMYVQPFYSATYCLRICSDALHFLNPALVRLSGLMQTYLTLKNIVYCILMNDAAHFFVYIQFACVSLNPNTCLHHFLSQPKQCLNVSLLVAANQSTQTLAL